MVIAGAAQIGVIEQSRRRAVFGGWGLRLPSKESRDGLVVEGADFHRSGRDGFGSRWIDAAEKLENAQAASEALLRVATTGEDRGNQPFRIRPDLGCPTTEPVRRPIGITPM